MTQHWLDDMLCNALVAAQTGEYDQLNVEQHLEMIIDRIRVIDDPAYKVLLAAHRVADEMDEIDRDVWTSLGGVTLGGAIRHEVHDAYGVTMDECPACKELAREYLDNLHK